MEPTSRLEEAIKQTRIAKQEVGQSETARCLDQGLDSLQTALTSLENVDRVDAVRYEERD